MVTRRQFLAGDSFAVVIDELIPAIDRELGVLPRALLGWSMGGYGSLLAAEQFPSLFRAVCAASPALWLTAGESADGAFDSAEDYASHDVFANAAALLSLRVRVDCGTDDGLSMQPAPSPPNYPTPTSEPSPPANTTAPTGGRLRRPRSPRSRRRFKPETRARMRVCDVVSASTDVQADRRDVLCCSALQ